MAVSTTIKILERDTFSGYRQRFQSYRQLDQKSDQFLGTGTCELQTFPAQWQKIPHAICSVCRTSNTVFRIFQHRPLRGRNPSLLVQGTPHRESLFLPFSSTQFTTLLISEFLCFCLKLNSSFSLSLYTVFLQLVFQSSFLLLQL